MLYWIFFSLFMCRFDPFLVRVLLHSTVYIHPFLHRVVPDLFLSLSLHGIPILFVFFFFLLLRPYLLIRLFMVSYRIFSSFFPCHQPYLSIHLFIVSYWIWSSLFPCHFDPFFARVLLLGSLRVILRSCFSSLFVFFVLLLVPN